MDKVQQISDAIISIQDLPEFFKLIQSDISTHSSRLVYLLYGKDNNYEGPLYNGLQKNEWAMITLLISNWLIETIHSVKPREYDQHIHELFFQYNLTEVATKIVIVLINSDIFPLSPEEKLIVLALLHSEHTISFLNNQIESILNKLQGWCKCSGTSHKKIVKVTNETGNRCTFVNSVHSLRLLPHIETLVKVDPNTEHEDVGHVEMTEVEE